jgi:hypothetical protein
MNMSLNSVQTDLQPWKPLANKLQPINLWRWWVGTILLVLLFTHQSARANDKQTKQQLSAKMTISPDQCVAMTEGQTCYVDIELQWQTSNIGEYCLFSSGQEKALKCWSNTSKGNFQQEVASKQNVIYTLRKQQTNARLAQSKLEMAWVHKRRGKPTTWWRLF